MATAADSRNDVLTTSAVLLSTVLSHLTGWDVLDGLMGVAVAAFILWSGWGLMMDTLSPLLGESPSPELVEHIEHTVMSYPGVLGVHDLMVHDYGPGHQFASLHMSFPPGRPAGSPRHHRQHRAGFSEKRPLTGHHPLRPHRNVGRRRRHPAEPFDGKSPSDGPSSVHP